MIPCITNVIGIGMPVGSVSTSDGAGVLARRGTPRNRCDARPGTLFATTTRRRVTGPVTGVAKHVVPIDRGSIVASPSLGRPTCAYSANGAGAVADGGSFMNTLKLAE